MKKYSLVWWYQTGKAFRQQGSRSNQRYARGFIQHLAYKLGYLAS